MRSFKLDDDIAIYPICASAVIIISSPYLYNQTHYKQIMSSIHLECRIPNKIPKMQVTTLMRKQELINRAAHIMIAQKTLSCSMDNGFLTGAKPVGMAVTLHRVCASFPCLSILRGDSKTLLTG